MQANWQNGHLYWPQQNLNHPSGVAPMYINQTQQKDPASMMHNEQNQLPLFTMEQFSRMLNQQYVANTFGLYQQQYAYAQAPAVTNKPIQQPLLADQNQKQQEVNIKANHNNNNALASTPKSNRNSFYLDNDRANMYKNNNRNETSTQKRKDSLVENRKMSRESSLNSRRDVSVRFEDEIADQDQLKDKNSNLNSHLINSKLDSNLNLNTNSNMNTNLNSSVLLDENEAEEEKTMCESENWQKTKSDSKKEKRQTRENKDESDQTARKSKPYMSAYSIKYTSIFSCACYPQFQNAISNIYAEIRKHKGTHVHTAFFNRKNDLVIVTDNIRDKTEIEKPWPNEAFISGITLKMENKKCFAVVKGVAKRITEEAFLEEAKVENNINAVLRLQNKNREKTSSMRIEVETEEAVTVMVRRGIYVNSRHYRVEYWENRVIRCFKCNGFGHKANTCARKEICGKCGGEHDSLKCEVREVNKYTCPNCGKTGHASWSNKCEKYISARVAVNVNFAEIVKRKTELQELKANNNALTGRMPITTNRQTTWNNKNIDHSTIKEMETKIRLLEEEKQAQKDHFENTVKKQGEKINELSTIIHALLANIKKNENSVALLDGIDGILAQQRPKTNTQNNATRQNISQTTQNVNTQQENIIQHHNQITAPQQNNQQTVTGNIGQAHGGGPSAQSN